MKGFSKILARFGNICAEVPLLETPAGTVDAALTLARVGAGDVAVGAAFPDPRFQKKNPGFSRMLGEEKARVRTECSAEYAFS